MLQIDPYRKWRTYLPGTQSPGPAYEYRGGPDSEMRIKGTVRKDQPGMDWGGIDLQTGEQTGVSRWRAGIDELQRHGADITLDKEGRSDYRGGSVWEAPFHDPKDRFDYYANKAMAGGRGGIAPRREDFVVGKPAQAQAPSGGNVFANLLNRPETDTDFWDKLKEQLGEAGADYDKADQPFKSLADTNVGTARPQPVKMPSMLTTRGIPTGGSYNPYLGDPAKRKRSR